MKQRLFVSLVLALCLGLMAVSSVFAVNFIVNPGFEIAGTTEDAAPPWSKWGGTGGRIMNPFSDANNSSTWVWSNFGNPTYVNVAAQNNFSNVWLIPGATYHVHFQIYIPSSEIVGTTIPRAGVYLSMMTAGTIRALDPRFPDAASNPVSATISPLDQWVTYDFDWVAPTTWTEPMQVNYLSYRWYGGDGTNLSTAANPNPGGYIDNCEWSSNAYTGVINGVVKTAAGPAAGATVQLNYKGNLMTTITTGADGVFSFPNLIPGQPYLVSIIKSNYLGTSVTANASTNLGDIVLANDPNYDPDMLFNVTSSSFAGNPGDATGNWACVNPSGSVLTTMATPTIASINDQKWELNRQTDGDGFVFGGVNSAPIPVNGATIIAAVRPIRYGGANNWQSVVDIFYDRLCLGIRNGDGLVNVRRNGSLDFSTAAIPNGQITILSLVVQPDNSYKVYANGTEVMNIAADPARPAMNQLDPLWNGGNTGFWSYINVGRNNPDGWTTFNGNIGDVYVYKVAIDDAKRTAIESALTTKFGTSPVYTITSSAGTGGTINPVGNIQVPMSTDQSFTVTPDKYFDVTSLLVDGVNAAAGTDTQTYTFTNVTANHTIAASFTEWVPTYVTGKVALANGTGVEGVTVKATGGREPLTVATAADGTYSLRVKPGVSYTVTAFKRGYAMAPASLVAGTGDLTGKNFTATYVGAQKLIDLKVDDTWTDAQSITTWKNNGILGGNFVSDGGKSTAAATVADSYVGKKALVFNNSKLMLSSDTTTADASLVRAPESITGNGAYTVCAEIATTTALPGEQYYFAFAHTGDNANTAAFNYGTAAAWGAVAHWGGTDMGWTTPEAEGGPAINQWHFFAISFDGAVEKVYLDGVEVNSEAKTLALWPNNPFVVGSRFGDNNATDRGAPFNGALRSLEVYDAALSAGEIGAKAGLIVFSGKVTLEDGTTPVPGALITAIGETKTFTTTSAADGKYSIGLNAGEVYYITAAKDSYAAQNEYYDVVSSSMTFDFKMRLINAVTGVVKNAAGQPIYNAVVQVGDGGPAAVTGADGKFTVMGITAGPGVSFYADALGYAAYTETIDTSAASTGAITKDVVLTAKAEAGVIQNGGFEASTIDPWYKNNGSPEVGVTTADKFSGNQSGYWKATEAAYYVGYLTYRLPILDGSTYNIYFKLKTNAVGAEGQCGFDWLDESGNSLMWWGYAGGGTSWMYTPVVGQWEQALKFRSWNDADHVTGVRMTPPAGAKAIQLIMGLGAKNIGDTLYVDDVVIDRVGPDPTTISGKVTLGVGGPGIAGAVVFATATSPAGPSSLNATTDANGNYTIQNVMPGTYYLTAAKGGYVPGAEVSVVAGSTPAIAANIVMSTVPTHKLIDLKAANYANGVWTNNGTLGGTFNCDTTTVPAAGTVGGYKAVNFNGAQRLLGTMLAPSQITGNGSWTVSGWLYDAPGGSYGTYLAWVRGMGGAPASACFLYDNDPAWGAGDFGAIGIGYKTLPTGAKWHNVVMTYDHATLRVYVDGVLDNSAAALLNQIAGSPFSVGATYDVDGGATPKWFLTGNVASIEVYDFDKTAADVSALYNAGPDGNGLPVQKAIGVNNKSVLTDAKLVGKYVRVWGAVVSKGATSYVIDDGYGVGVTVKGTTDKAVGQMVVVNGTVQTDKSVQP